MDVAVDTRKDSAPYSVAVAMVVTAVPVVDDLVRKFCIVVAADVGSDDHVEAAEMMD